MSVVIYKKFYFVTPLLIAILLLTGCQTKKPEVLELSKTLESSNLQIMGQLKLKSPAFEPQGSIPSKYTCDGQGINPPLQISEVPEGAQSLVLIIDDPDAPRCDWVHWLLWNITPQTSQIPENSVPQNAVQGKTDFGRSEYGGPCPPSGTHRYQFKLYALDTVLDLPSKARKKDLEEAMQGHILDQVMLVGLYSK